MCARRKLILLFSRIPSTNLQFKAGSFIIEKKSNNNSVCDATTQAAISNNIHGGLNTLILNSIKQDHATENHIDIYEILKLRVTNSREFQLIGGLKSPVISPDDGNLYFTASFHMLESTEPNNCSYSVQSVQAG